MKRTEIDIILAALRLWQQTPVASDDLYNIASCGGSHPPLTLSEIDDLCERLNLGDKS